MFKNCNGFSMIELLISLSIWLLLLLILLPPLTHIVQERKNIQLINTANHIVSNRLQIYHTESYFIDEQIEVSNYKFTVAWEDANELLAKVCVSYTDFRKEEKKRCGYTNK
ncbi:competence type IV pilus minor pilin ComGE [Bacillus sp. SM2101]|uniref:competence type IV pilus minor pilin ComGE n=1 Tax=Bacillaceae TaxID=186817 RepID=UPI00331BCF6A